MRLVGARVVKAMHTAIQPDIDNANHQLARLRPTRQRSQVFCGDTWSSARRRTRRHCCHQRVSSPLILSHSYSFVTFAVWEDTVFTLLQIALLGRGGVLAVGALRLCHCTVIEARQKGGWNGLRATGRASCAILLSCPLGRPCPDMAFWLFGVAEGKSSRQGGEQGTVQWMSGEQRIGGHRYGPLAVANVDNDQQQHLVIGALYIAAQRAMKRQSAGGTTDRVHWGESAASRDSSCHGLLLETHACNTTFNWRRQRLALHCQSKSAIASHE
ncbi:unnamed protein product [Ostreobium quekettii]|uniref:Uncharacterized protein n=1 Tax=Ostreobium quekettii TaxID=121088 RepID=A0A8S1IZB5_9CHLO|nr:unnamed protein product [Ostreobium quekettii]